VNPFAIYLDGNRFTLDLNGSIVRDNTANEGGGAIFYVSNDRSPTRPDLLGTRTSGPPGDPLPPREARCPRNISSWLRPKSQVRRWSRTPSCSAASHRASIACCSERGTT
jgi:hypothetical protein